MVSVTCVGVVVVDVAAMEAAAAAVVIAVTATGAGVKCSRIMALLEALRRNQLHSILKKPLPFSERGAISIGT